MNKLAILSLFAVTLTAAVKIYDADDTNESQELSTFAPKNIEKVAEETDSEGEDLYIIKESFIPVKGHREKSSCPSASQPQVEKVVSESETEFEVEPEASDVEPEELSTIEETH